MRRGAGAAGGALMGSCALRSLPPAVEDARRGGGRLPLTSEVAGYAGSAYSVVADHATFGLTRIELN